MQTIITIYLITKRTNYGEIVKRAYFSKAKAEQFIANENEFSYIIEPVELIGD